MSFFPLADVSFDDTVKMSVIKYKQNTAKPKKEVTIVADPSRVTSINQDASKSVKSLATALKSERRQSDNFLRFLQNAVKQNEHDDDQSVLGETTLTDALMVGHGVDASNSRAEGFNATEYFNVSGSDLSNIFERTKDESVQRDQENVPVVSTEKGKSLRDKEKIILSTELEELSTLPGRERRNRLSEIFDNDSVMMYIHEPTLAEDLKNFQDNISSNRRDSDLFEKRLRHILENH